MSIDLSGDLTSGSRETPLVPARTGLGSLWTGSAPRLTDQQGQRATGAIYVFVLNFAEPLPRCRSKVMEFAGHCPLH